MCASDFTEIENMIHSNFHNQILLCTQYHIHALVAWNFFQHLGNLTLLLFSFFLIWFTIDRSLSTNHCQCRISIAWNIYTKLDNNFVVSILVNNLQLRTLITTKQPTKSIYSAHDNRYYTAGYNWNNSVYINRYHTAS